MRDKEIIIQGIDIGHGESKSVECVYCKDEGWVITNGGFTCSPCPMNCREQNKQ